MNFYPGHDIKLPKQSTAFFITMSHELDTIIRAFIAAKEAKEAAEANYNEVRDLLQDAMAQSGQTSYTGAFAKVAIVSRKQWQYPADVIRLEEQLKAEKKTAERTGTAEIVGHTVYPRVTVTE